MKRKKLAHLPDGQPREAGPHGRTLDMLAVEGPAPTFVKMFRAEAVKGKAWYRKVGDWSPHTNPERDQKRHARLRKDVPVERTPVEQPLRKRSTATGGRQVLIGGGKRKAEVHPWRERLAHAMAGGPTTKSEVE